MKAITTFMLLISMLTLRPAYAREAPMSLPEITTVYSSNGDYFVQLHPDYDATHGVYHKDKPDEVIWTFKKWVYHGLKVLLSNDGQRVVLISSIYYGGIINFIGPDGSLKQHRAEELLPTRDHHWDYWHWTFEQHFEDYKLIVKSIGIQRFTFDLNSGELIDTEAYRPYLFFELVDVQLMNRPVWILSPALLIFAFTLGIAGFVLRLALRWQRLPQLIPRHI